MDSSIQRTINDRAERTEWTSTENMAVAVTPAAAAAPRAPVRRMGMLVNLA